MSNRELIRRHQSKRSRRHSGAEHGERLFALLWDRIPFLIFSRDKKKNLIIRHRPSSPLHSPFAFPTAAQGGGLVLSGLGAGPALLCAFYRLFLRDGLRPAPVLPQPAAAAAAPRGDQPADHLGTHGLLLLVGCQDLLRLGGLPGKVGCQGGGGLVANDRK